MNNQIMDRAGFEINPRIARAELADIKPFGMIPTPIISDVLGRSCGVIGLRRYHRAGRLIGPAFTVKTRPGDNLMIHKALDLMSPGDVLVIDGGGELSNALIGALMHAYALKQGVGGFVIDGAIRDVETFAASDLPCFARGNTHRGPYKDGPGAINVPVNIGGQVILPGDVVVGDEDGVVSFSPTGLRELLELCNQKLAAEETQMAEISGGTFTRAWMDSTLRQKGVL